MSPTSANSKTGTVGRSADRLVPMRLAVPERAARDPAWRRWMVAACAVALANVLAWLLRAHAAVVFLLLLSYIACFTIAIEVYLCAYRRARQAELLIRGIRPARCFECGYVLWGAESGACPECGTRYLPGPPASPVPAPAP